MNVAALVSSVFCSESLVLEVELAGVDLSVVVEKRFAVGVLLPKIFF